MIELEAALFHIPADDREVWIRMGMAVKSAVGEVGFDLWDRWSQQSDRYKAHDARIAWRSFHNGGGVTEKSLFHEARIHGWKGTPDRVERPRSDSRQREQLEQQLRQNNARKAAARAEWILKQCKLEEHAYLSSKGFPKAKGLVWWAGAEDNRLVIPMRVGVELVGVQHIDRHGTKKFLTGSKTGGAEYVMDAKGIHVLCEGYATALSVQAALAQLRVPYRIHTTFSANNMIKVARGLRPGAVIADNDESGTGEKAAKEIGWPYWISDRTNEDFNDYHQRVGLFRASQALRGVMRPP